MSRAKAVFCVLIAVAFLVAVLPAAGQEKKASSSGTGPNVLVTLTISKTGGSGAPQKVFKLIGQDDSEAMMMVGWRTPIPTVSSAREDAGKPPVTSYVYQNVGVNAKLTIKVLDGGRIQLRGGIEISGVRETQAGDSGGQKAPLIGTFQQTLTAVVVEGKKLRVAESPDPEGGTLSLDIEAEVLR
jgi:hypothetical protein